MRIQAPPNLVSRQECLALIGAGVDDWGGVSPLTPDHVNPERPWPALDELAAVTAEAGYDLVQRLTAQPQYVQAGAAWIDPRVQGHVAALADPETGLARDVEPGRPAMAGARRGHRVAGPHRPEHRHRLRGPAHRDPQRPRQCVRRLGVHPREGQRAGGPGTGAHRHRRARGAALGRARPGRLQRRRIPGAGHRRRSGTGCRCRAGRFAASRRRRRRRDVRRQPQHQLHQHLLHRLPVLRVRPAQGRRRRVLAVHRRGRRPGVGGARRRRHRGLHAGRHRPRAAGHRLRRSGARGEGAGAVDARARVLADGDRQRRHQERHLDSRVADQSCARRASAPFRERPRRSSTTRSAGC